MERKRTVLAWILWAIAVGELVALLVSGGFLQDAAEEGGQIAVAVAVSVFVLAFATVGAVVASRRSSNPIGWLMCAVALAFATASAGLASAESLAQAGRTGLLARWLGWASTWMWGVGGGMAGTFLLLLFPNGRPHSRRWLPVLYLAGISIGLVALGIALTPGPLDLEEAILINPVGLRQPRLLSVMNAAGGVGMTLAFVASIASLFARFQGAGSEQRQQLKWLLFGGFILAVAVVGSLSIDVAEDRAVNVSNAIFTAGLTAVPVTMAIAILRHRLYDIDVIINRALVYGALTAVLAGVYLLSVLALQYLVRPLTRESDLAVAAATLAVAALFRPLRNRVQAFIDKRFYRRRYDAKRTLEGFVARLRSEVDVDSIGYDVTEVVESTMRPAHVSLWLHPGREGSV